MSQNPYARPKPVAEPQPKQEEQQPKRQARQGAQGPQVGIPTPLDRLARVAIPAHAANTVWWVGTHGGSGESTLAKLLPGSFPSDHRWPIPPPPKPALVVLTARTSFHGLTSAQRAATEWASGAIKGVNVLGLVLVADAPGKLPRVLSDFASVISGGLPRVWNISWIESWRRGEEVTPDNTPDQVFKVLEEIYAVAAQAANG